MCEFTKISWIINHAIKHNPICQKISAQFTFLGPLGDENCASMRRNGFGSITEKIACGAANNWAEDAVVIETRGGRI